MLYRLVKVRVGSKLIRVFLPTRLDAGGPPGTLVHLRNPNPPTGRRFLGRDVRDRRSYREFRSEVELLLAGYEPAGSYRVCDSWDAFLNPWAAPAMNDRPTEQDGRVM